MSVQQPEHALSQKKAMTFAVVSIVGAAALVLGLALIVFAHYHERAYIFLVPGAGAFIGGLAGMIVVGQKVRVVVDYGLIAMGCVAMVEGFIFLTGTHDTKPSLMHGYPVIALSAIAILTGIFSEMLAQSKHGFAGFWSVIVLGVIGLG